MRFMKLSKRIEVNTVKCWTKFVIMNPQHSRISTVRYSILRQGFQSFLFVRFIPGVPSKRLQVCESVAQPS